MSAGWLLPALVIPVSALVAVVEDTGAAAVWQSISTSVLTFVPILAIVAALAPRFGPRQAAFAAAAFALYDAGSARELLFSLVLAAAPLTGAAPDNPNWITLGLMACGLAFITVATLRRATLARFAIAVFAFGHLMTLGLFHTVAVDTPAREGLTSERRLVADLHARGGLDGLATLCGVDGRICRRGAPDALLASIDPSDRDSQILLRTIADTRLAGGFTYVWRYIGFNAASAEILRHTAIAKGAPDDVLIVISEAGPTRAFNGMRIGYSWLSVAFQQAWTMLIVAVIWRHGELRLARVGRRLRWVRESHDGQSLRRSA